MAAGQGRIFNFKYSLEIVHTCCQMCVILPPHTLIPFSLAGTSCMAPSCPGPGPAPSPSHSPATRLPLQLSAHWKLLCLWEQKFHGRSVSGLSRGSTALAALCCRYSFVWTLQKCTDRKVVISNRHFICEFPPFATRPDPPRPCPLFGAGWG